MLGLSAVPVIDEVISSATFFRPSNLDRARRGLGDLSASEIENAKKRWLKHVSPEPNTGCWLWTNALTSRGYGWFGLSQKNGAKIQATAHRAGYLFFRGDIAPGLELDHRHCALKCCVNPWHLEAVTHLENMRSPSGATYLNHFKTICTRGHALVPENVRPARRDAPGRRCMACSKIYDRMRCGAYATEAEATEAARRDWPDLFAAAEKRIAGIVNKRARLNAEVTP